MRQMRGWKSLPLVLGVVAVWMFLGSGVISAENSDWFFPGLAGVVLLAVAGYLFRRTRAFLRTAWPGDGAVTDLVRGRVRPGSSRNSFYPVVRFTTITGESFEFKSSVGTNPPAFQIGQEVRVFYDPHDPSQARIASFRSLWFACILLGGLGVVFTSISVLEAILG